MDNKTSIHHLKEKKLRVTRLRVAVLDILSKNRMPLSVPELLIELTRHRLDPHKTSIYRELEALKNHSLVKEIQFGENKKRYEIVGVEHHHHIICTNCGTVEDIHLDKDLDDLEKKITKTKKFLVTEHALEFFGRCFTCRHSVLKQV